ncbi:MAG TPA: cell division protein FtsZ [Bacteroidales bacterium]|jgi:cell division protein FtsZ|nr:cell division protein FtsZ [Bacteroidales bacterium]
MDELMNFELPVNNSSIIKVLGVGGGGSNAVNHMFRQGIKDVDFIVCNTDAQALANSPVPVKIQLGASLTEGRGAGNKPVIGRQAAIESLDNISELLSANTRMLFITAGMGGGTGTGAAPVIAQAAKELGILTVAIVTIPFRNEGPRRINQALEGIAELEKNVDSLLVINNEKIRQIHGDLRLSEAFSRADDVLTVAAKGIAEIITVHGFINVDFADVQTVMTNSGVSILGTGTASGEGRAIEAIKEALNSPLLNDTDIKGARNILLNIISGSDEVTMDEIGQIIDYVKDCSGINTDLIWGNGTESTLGDKISVTVIATGFNAGSIPELYIRKREIDRIPLAETIVAPDNEDSIFVLKDAPTQKPVIGIPSQRTIEFEMADDEMLRTISRVRKPVDVRKATERVNSIKRTQDELRELKQGNRPSDREIEELENTPAFKRKQIQIDNQKYSDETKISKYTLSDDDESIKLSKQNPYLHGAVD